MLLYRHHDSVPIGECLRFKVTLDCSATRGEWDQLAISVKGPFFISCQIYRGQTLPGCFQQKEAPRYTPLIKPSQRWSYQIPIPEHGKVERTVSILSEVIFSRTARVPFEVKVELVQGNASTRPDNTLTALVDSTSTSPRPRSPVAPEKSETSKDGDYINEKYIKVTSSSAWDNTGPSAPVKGRKRHLVILQHGLHATRNDLLYIKERLEESSRMAAKRAGRGVPDLCIVACPDNHGLTENGIVICGQRLALFILTQAQWTIDGDKDAIDEVPYDKISLVAHSFGGPICLYAMAYLQTVSHGKFFEAIRPTSFVCFASPLLGVGAPIQFVKTVLGSGVLGQTGSDLGLRPVKRRPEEVVPEIQTGLPVLEALSRPGGAAHQVVEAFETRTVYANICNDSVVPLAVAALLCKYMTVIAIGAHHPVVEPDAHQKSLGIRSWPPESAPTAITDAPTGNADATASPFLKLSAKFSDPLRMVTELFNPHPSERLDPLKAVMELLQPQLPPEDVYLAPQRQDDPIIYDKFSLESIAQQSNSSAMTIEERIARNWHTTKADYDSIAISSMSWSPTDQITIASKAKPVPTGGLRWRKVLLRFDRDIDAHTNVIMRRLASAWGWRVIEHLVQVHPWEGDSGTRPDEDSKVDRERKEDQDAEIGVGEESTQLEVEGQREE